MRDSVRTVNVPQLQRTLEMELERHLAYHCSCATPFWRATLQELEATLADIADKRKTIAGAMEGPGPGMFDDEGRQGVPPYQAVNEFWKVGEEPAPQSRTVARRDNVRLPGAGSHPSPARQQNSAVLDSEKKRQSQRLSPDHQRGEKPGRCRPQTSPWR